MNAPCESRGDPFPDQGKTTRELRAQRLERTAIGLFCAIGGFLAGMALTIIIFTTGA